MLEDGLFVIRKTKKPNKCVTVTFRLTTDGYWLGKMSVY